MIEGIAWRALVFLLPAFVAGKVLDIVLPLSWSKREILFPIYEWLALLGGCVGFVAVLALWIGLKGVL